MMQKAGITDHMRNLSVRLEDLFNNDEAFQVAFTPEEIVRNKLINESAAHSNSPDHQASNFYFTIGLAWDALAYDRYEAGSSAEGIAGSTLNSYAGSPQGSPEIRLTDPLQVKVIDALTEAVGIPHRRGQTVIEIPEKLKGRNYTRWKLSPEYASRLAQAQARRRRKLRVLSFQLTTQGRFVIMKLNRQAPGSVRPLSRVTAA